MSVGKTREKTSIALVTIYKTFLEIPVEILGRKEILLVDGIQGKG